MAVYEVKDPEAKRDTFESAIIIAPSKAIARDWVLSHHYHSMDRAAARERLTVRPVTTTGRLELISVYYRETD